MAIGWLGGGKRGGGGLEALVEKELKANAWKESLTEVWNLTFEFTKSDHNVCYYYVTKYIAVKYLISYKSVHKDSKTPCYFWSHNVALWLFTCALFV